MIWLIIYLVGYIFAIFLDIKDILTDRDYTCSDIFDTLLLSLPSWILVICILIININGDTVIFKKKG